MLSSGPILLEDVLTGSDVRHRSSELAHKKRIVILRKTDRLLEGQRNKTVSQVSSSPSIKFHERVVNLSDTEIDPSGTELLERGFKYVPNLPFGL
jgi:hypothetical protein